VSAKEATDRSGPSVRARREVPSTFQEGTTFHYYSSNQGWVLTTFDHQKIDHQEIDHLDRQERDQPLAFLTDDTSLPIAAPLGAGRKLSYAKHRALGT
jgi:hypothetical protein